MPSYTIYSRATLLPEKQQRFIYLKRYTFYCIVHLRFLEIQAWGMSKFVSLHCCRTATWLQIGLGSLSCKGRWSSPMRPYRRSTEVQPHVATEAQWQGAAAGHHDLDLWALVLQRRKQRGRGAGEGGGRGIRPIFSVNPSGGNLQQT